MTNEPRERETVRVDVFRGLNSFEDVKTLNDLISKLTKLRDEVPVECRDTVKVEIEEGYADENATFNAYYWRPETDGEMQKRIFNEDWLKQRRDKEERAAYERLKRKFEPKA